MNYEEMIQKALKGRSVNSVAKAWGLQQSTLNRYVRGERMPDFDTALKMATEAGVSPGEALEALAAEERSRKVKNFKLQMGFVQNSLICALAIGGTAGVKMVNFILCKMPTGRKHNPIISHTPLRNHPA